MLYRVKDLSPEQRHAVSNNSLDPSTIIPSRLSPEERIAALRALDERFAARPVPEVSPEEEEALVREAFHATRSDRRPVS